MEEAPVGVQVPSRQLMRSRVFVRRLCSGRLGMRCPKSRL